MRFLYPAAIKAIASMLTPRLFAILICTILATILTLVAGVAAIGVLTLYVSAHLHSTLLAGAIVWGGTMGSALLAWLLFPAIMPIIVSFFDTKIAGAIEKQDYADMPRGAAPAFWPELAHDLCFALKAVLLNILCLPLYLVPFVNLFVFYVLNGYLLGKEFFLIAARRFMPLWEAESLRRQYSRPIFLGGALITFCATIPFVNLIAVFWGVAMMTHLFHLIYAEQKHLMLPSS